MSERTLTPERFARLMSLPPDHPERSEWNGHPEFESMRALYTRFEEARPSGADARDLREVEAILEQRFRDALESGSRAEVSRAPVARPARAARPWWGAIPRPAFAMAAVLAVVAGGVWLTARPRSTAMRGAEDVPVIAAPRHVDDGLELRWTPVAGAANYRLSFVDGSMREVATVEGWPGTSYVLKASALLPGLEHGADVVLQVQSVRDGGTSGAVGSRSIRIP